MHIIPNRRWSQENPHWQVPVRSIEKSITVWAAIYNDVLIGPYFFDGTVNQHVYLAMLEEFLIPEMEHRGINIQNVIFQQDGAPPHSTNIVTAWLNNHFNTWIGRRSPNKWPARSPDLTVLDYFLWGYIKNDVYQKTSANMEELRMRIVEAFQKVTPVMLRNATQGLRRRLDSCIAQNGGLFEAHL